MVDLAINLEFELMTERWNEGDHRWIITPAGPLKYQVDFSDGAKEN